MKLSAWLTVVGAFCAQLVAVAYFAGQTERQIAENSTTLAHLVDRVVEIYDRRDYLNDIADRVERLEARPCD